MSASLLESLRSGPDRRRAEGKRFDLAGVLLYAILGMVAGANSFRQIHEFIRVHLQRLNETFGLRLPCLPSYTGWRLIIQGVDPAGLEAAFRRCGRFRRRLPQTNWLRSPSTANLCAAILTLSATVRRRTYCRRCSKPSTTCSAI